MKEKIKIPSHKPDLTPDIEALVKAFEKNQLEVSNEVNKIPELKQATVELVKEKKVMNSHIINVGANFEQTSKFGILQYIIPTICTPEEAKHALSQMERELTQEENGNEFTMNNYSPIHILHSVTFGADVEFDFVIVRGQYLPFLTEGEQKALNDLSVSKVIKTATKAKRHFLVSEILQIVECKANFLDIIHNIPVMQSALSWFTNTNSNDHGPYTRPTWGNQYFTSGSFDRLTAHKRGDDLFLFYPEVFATFKRNAANLFDERIAYVSKDKYPGTVIFGDLPGKTSREILDRCFEFNFSRESVEDVRKSMLPVLQAHSGAFSSLGDLGKVPLVLSMPIKF